MCTGFLIIFINVTYITENDKLFHYNTKGKQDRSSLLSRLQKLCQWGWYNGTDNNQGIGEYGFLEKYQRTFCRIYLMKVRLFLIRKRKWFFIHAAEQKQCILCIPEKWCFIIWQSTEIERWFFILGKRTAFKSEYCK